MADAAVNKTMNTGSPYIRSFSQQGLAPRCGRFLLHFDGGKRTRGAGSAGAAWILFGASERVHDATKHSSILWKKLAVGGWPLTSSSTALSTELIACCGGLRMFDHFLQTGEFRLFTCNELLGTFQIWDPG